MASTNVLPAAVCAVLVVVILCRAQTPLADVARYAAYWAIAVMLPGLILWRCVRGRAGRLVDDVAAGAGIGLAVELFTYLAAAATGHPRWYLVVPLGVVVAGAAVPTLRRRWLRRAETRTPTATAWLLAAVVVWAVVIVAAGSAYDFVNHPLADGYPLAAYPDMPFQLALAAEAKHHFPLTTPYVAGEPLHYHYFAHVHMAAASWTSGVDLPIVVYRLFVVPIVVLSTVLTATVARRLCDREWVGVLAALVAVTSTSPVGSSWNIATIPYVSPTQGYANLLLGAVLLLLVDCLRGDSRPLDWALVAPLLAASAASKGTVLPIVIGSLGVTAVVQGLLRKRWRPPLLGLGLSLAAWVVALFTVFGGESLGLGVHPLHLLGGPRQPGIVLTLLTMLVFWGAPLLGALLVLVRGIRDPGKTFVAAAVLGGAAAAMLFGQSSHSEVYFVRTVAAAGAAVAVAAIGGLAVESRRALPVRVAAVAVVTALAATTLVTRVASAPSDVVTALAGTSPGRTSPVATVTTPDELAGARWLRSHADTDDIVATNQHCRRVTENLPRHCDERAFWLAGTAERRVLVEGWAYTSAWRAYTDEYGDGDVPFPDRTRLRANDAAFDHPTGHALDELRDRYGVRWLYARELDGEDERALDRLAELRYESGDVRVYQLG